MGVDPGSLPPRPTPAKLVALADAEPRRSNLRAELVTSGAELIITLGQEGLDAVRAVADAAERTQERLEPVGYGRRGRVVIGGHRAELLPLVHPGFARQTKRPDWTAALERWRASVGR